MKKAKILIITQDNTIEKVRKQVLDVLDTRTFTVSKNHKHHLYIEDSITITEAITFGQGCRGYRADLIAIDGDFTDEELELIYPIGISYRMNTSKARSQYILTFPEFIDAYKIYYGNRVGEEK